MMVIMAGMVVATVMGRKLGKILHRFLMPRE